MKLNLRSISLISLITIGITFLIPSVVRAEGSDELQSPTLFILDSCPHCTELLEELEELDLGEFNYTEIEISEEKQKELALEAIEICNENDSGVPLLYIDGECWVGRIDVLQQIKTAAGIELDITTEDTDKEDSTSLDQEPNGDQTTEELESNSLADRIEDSAENREGIKITNLLVILAAVTILIGISYYLLSKFKL